MLKKRIIALIEKQKTLNKKMELYPEEKKYAEKYELIPTDYILIEKNSASRFLDAVIERCEKETEETISKEKSDFLQQSIQFLKYHTKEFIYIESRWLDIIGADALSIEMDDVFGNYDVMLGLKVQKKFEKVLKEQLNNQLIGEGTKFDLMFSPEDGLWNLNFSLNNTIEFHEDITLGEAYQIIYHFLFKLVEAVEEKE